MKVNILKERNGRFELQVLYPRADRKAPVILRAGSKAVVHEGLAALIAADKGEETHGEFL